MVILQESPWYQQIFKEGEKRGEKPAILSSIELNLEIKFSQEGLQFIEIIYVF